MGNPERLRAQAVRLFALAIQARETDVELSEQLAARAIQLQDEAAALEYGKKMPPMQDTSRQSDIQQKEQVQPDEGGTEQRRSRRPAGKR